LTLEHIACVQVIQLAFAIELIELKFTRVANFARLKHTQASHNFFSVEVAFKDDFLLITFSSGRQFFNFTVSLIVLEFSFEAQVLTSITLSLDNALTMAHIITEFSLVNK